MQSMEKTQIRKEEIFHQLHHNGKLLILPNVWDPFGAMLLEKLGYPAAATSSSAVSISQGYKDGENLPFEELLHILSRMVKYVNIPVTADVETAYANNDHQLQENIKKLIDTGIAGINYEDSRHGEASILSIDEQCRRIEFIKRACIESGSKLFMNARIDVYIKGGNMTPDQKLEEAVKRGKAYKEAGADGLYPIILKDKAHIEAIVKETGLPLNVTMVPGIPSFKELESIGVARISMASGYFKNAVFAMKQVAENLIKHEGMDEAFDKMVSSDYLSEIV